MTEPRKAIRWWELALLVAILLAATVLRTWRLAAVPPGLTHDEAAHGHDAIAILHGARPIYEPVGYGREPLYDYWIAGLMSIAGNTREVLRFSAVPLGLITLLATFAWTRLAYDRSVALASTALQSVSFWSIATGRQALRSTLLPALITPAIFFFWRLISEGENAPNRWRLGAFALLIGASLYTYVPARALWAMFPLFLLYLRAFHRSRFREAAGSVVTGVGMGLLLAVPLFVYLRSHPGAEQRLAMLDAPLQALMRGDPSILLNRAWGFVRGLFVPGRGDDFLAYNIPGRPTIGPMVGVLFLIGLGVSAARWRQPPYAFSLLWLLIGVSPSLVTGPAASTTRSIAALPVVFVFPAVAMVAAGRWARKRAGPWGAWLVGAASCAMILLVGASSTYGYFVTWAESPSTRAAYQHTLVETAEYLDSEAEDGVVGISTSQPYGPHDPYVFEVSLSRRDLSMRWFDARRALLLPDEEEARLVIPASAPLSGVFGDLPGISSPQRVELRPDDLDPWFDVYHWRPRAARAELLSTVREIPATESQGSTLSDQDAQQNRIITSARFGGGLDLLGYNLRTPVVSPGGQVELVTVWRATDPERLQVSEPADVDKEPVLFVHAVDDSGALVAQEDRLDAPAWSWHEGDVIAQIHRLTLPPSLAADEVILAGGVYRRADMARFPVSVEGRVVGDSIVISSVKVEE